MKEEFEMNFKEISTWVVLIAYGLVTYSFLGNLSEAGGISTKGNILSAVMMFVIITIVAHIIIAIAAPKLKDTSDERDRDIERKGEVAASFTLGAFVLFILAHSALNENWLIANLAFIGLIASEIVKSTWQIFLYRTSS